ncbi:kinase suppressor of Ras 1 [Galendromus occidentalis]|uniref:Kinase suppressor of Ras 1 n=1 Tax=Galendromus occidentalis TaxID=34638 RepID=A0AAJ7L6F3_9ACAR|nr:kinase suppressor of Ras 1 [Galendromus occidentalis]
MTSSPVINRLARSEPSSPLVNIRNEMFFVEPVVPRLQRKLSATKKCHTCSKIVYFTGIRCKHCGFLAHEACADSSPPHSCVTSVLRRAQQTAFPFTPESISAANAMNASASAPVSPKSPRSPMSPTEFLRTAFSWIKNSRKNDTRASMKTPRSTRKTESKEARAATWASPETVTSALEDESSESEWCISAKDLQFNSLVRNGHDNKIYEGQWHGPVSIYTFQRSQDLWTQVNRLMQVRHENCTLFMGACIERNNLAIVTSPCDGPQVSAIQSQLRLDEKLAIANHVANGMGYLHAKGIVHGNFNSGNVIMEKRRAKVCLLDRTFPEAFVDRTDYGCLPKSILASLAPEFVKTIHVNGTKVSPRHPHSREGDVYAFGTFLYELFADETPFANLSATETLYKIGHGQTPDLSSKTSIPRPIRNLIAECWSVLPQSRPTFKQIASFLQENNFVCSQGLNKRHCASTPNSLNSIGCSLVGFHL